MVFGAWSMVPSSDVVTVSAFRKPAESNGGVHDGVRYFVCVNNLRTLFHQAVFLATGRTAQDVAPNRSDWIGV